MLGLSLSLSLLLSALGPQTQPAAPGAPQSGKVSVDRLDRLTKAKDWTAINALFETLPPKQQKEFQPWWLMALDRTESWQRLLEQCDIPEPVPGAPSDPVLAQFKGKALTKLGRHADALKWYLALGKAGDVPSYLRACNEAQILADWKGLQQCAEALLEKYPAQGDYLAMKGEALSKQGRFAEAEPVLREAVRLVPKRAMSWADLGCCDNELTRYKEALAAASQAVALEPNLVEGRYNQARACLGLKRYRDAREYFGAALALAPKDPVLVSNLNLNISMLDKYLAHQAGKTAGKPAAAPTR